MKIVEPAVDSIWERRDGTRFRVLIFTPGLGGQCQLQAVVSGRRHWVTSRGLQSKYRWISDPVGEDDIKELEQ